jgi:hypothetical protein
VIKQLGPIMTRNLGTIERKEEKRKEEMGK